MPFELQPCKNHLYVFAKTYSELLLGLFLGVALCEGLLYWFYSQSGKPSFVDGIEGSPFSPHLFLGTMWSVPFLAGAILWFSIWRLEQNERAQSFLTNQKELRTLRLLTPPPMFFTKLSFLASFFCLLLSADTVVLTTGDSIDGHLLSTDEHTIRLRDARGIIEEIPRERVSTIRFSASAADTGNTQSSVRPAGPPEQQQRFCELVSRFREEATAYMQETNPIRKAAMISPDPYRYEPQFRTLFGPEHKFLNWTGTLRFGTSGHSVGIVFTPTCDPPNPRDPVCKCNRTARLCGARPHELDPRGLAHRSYTRRGKSGRSTSNHLRFLGPYFWFGALRPSPGRRREHREWRALFRSQTNSSGASLAQPNYLVQFTSVNLGDANMQTPDRQR